MYGYPEKDSTLVSRPKKKEEQALTPKKEDKPPTTSPEKYDANAAVKYIKEHVTDSDPKGSCAHYIRLALEAGGLDTKGHPVYAKNYVAFLKTKGFSSIDSDQYNPVGSAQKGDIAVFENYDGGDKAGHIQIYTGSGWVSDFQQREFWPGPGYRKYKPKFTVFRK